jgi:phosphate transport system ATP-binding protein
MFMLSGEIVEYTETKVLFTNPKDARTENYVTGRLG